MKNYFSHDYNARNDKKLVVVFMRHGLAGIGAYWCIVEMLYEEGGYLLLNEYERISFELRIDSNVIRDIIERTELFQNDGEKFWSESCLNRLQERASKSLKARQSIENRWNRIREKGENTNVLRMNIDSNTNKVKESKVKESIYTCFSFDDFWNLYDKKVGDKQKLSKKWEKIGESERKKIKSHVESYKEAQPDKQFRKDPQTYLNNQSWNDEIISRNGNTGFKNKNNSGGGYESPANSDIFCGLKRD